MTRDIEREQKGRASGEQVSVTRLALETGVEFAGAARYLNETGRLTVSDGRMSATTLDTGAPVASSCKAFLAEAGHYHREISERACNGCAPLKPLKGITGLQKRLIGAIQARGDHSGLEAASLAMTFEEAGALIQEAAGERRFGRRLFEIAARTTDRVILTERSRGFDGLLSEIACRDNRSMREVGQDFERLKLLPKGDPRLSIPADKVNLMHRYHHEELLAHMKASLFSRVAELGPARDPAFSKERVIGDIVGLSALKVSGTARVDQDRRDRDFMTSMARIGERVAMNMHENGKDRESVTSVLATAETAVMRAGVFNQRVQAFEKELDSVRKSARRDGDPVLM